MHIAILGPGRLGRSLHALLRAGPFELSLWSRGQPVPACDVALLTVSDGAIAEVAAQVPAGPIVLHTSGATDVDVLRPHRPAGSLHPLQSFPGPEVAIPPVAGVPAALAGDPEAVAVARLIAEAVGFATFEVPGDRRLYHAAAVVAGNFATVLLADAARLLEAAGVDPEAAPSVLAPLALASIEQAARRGPAAALTGPFARGDLDVVERHLDAISSATPDLERLYRALGVRAATLSAAGGHLTGEELRTWIRRVT